MKIMATSAEKRLGVTVRPLTAKERESYGLEPDEGVAISSVDLKGVLGQAGFEVNDVILEINDIPVEGVDSFVDLVNALPHNQKVKFKALDHRSGETGYLEVNIH
jgi:S1-C subfamily serine protease